MTTQTIVRGPRDCIALGERREQAGDLVGAVRAYRYAADRDWPGAALRLATVLAKLADQRAQRGAYDDSLVAEASRWLAKAARASDPERIRLVMAMLERQQRHAARRMRGAGDR